MSNIEEHPCWDVPIPEDVPDNAYVEQITIGWRTHWWWVTPVEGGGYSTVREMTFDESYAIWECEQKEQQ